MTRETAGLPQRIRAAIDAFDRPQVAALCAELIENVRQDDRPYEEKTAAGIMSQLRRKRHFKLMQEVGDAFIQSGAASAGIRCLYAQSLLDQGNLTAGVAVLEQIVPLTAPCSHANTEARGLLGRAYKQMYIAAGPGERRAVFLERAIASYHGVSRECKDRWHGINASALLARAVRDAVPMKDYPDPGKKSRKIAKNVLRQIEAKGDAADIWDRATAVEACIALGRTDDALARLRAYVQDPEADAFHLASMLRQFTEVWQLTADTEPGTVALRLLQSALLIRQGGEELIVGSADINPATLEHIGRAGYEANFGDESFNSLTWFRNALERCRSVGRVEDWSGNGKGTGFLVAGKDLHPSFPPKVFVTNAHVVSEKVPDALHPQVARVTFRAIDRSGPDPHYYGISKIWWTSLPHDLDVTIVELDEYPDKAVLCPVAPVRPRMDGESPPQTYIIGHPDGTEQVLLSIRDNLVLDGDSTRIHYRTPTGDGNSGSPVFNRDWFAIALHHKGLRNMPRLHGKPGTYAANEGIWLESIRTRIEASPLPAP
jgi:V8-like Glu-specific endopeptidase